jgi:hypothetical protein
MVLTTHPPSSAKVTKGYSYTSIHPLHQLRPVMGVLYLHIHFNITVKYYVTPNHTNWTACTLSFCKMVWWSSKILKHVAIKIKKAYNYKYTIIVLMGTINNLMCGSQCIVMYQYSSTNMMYCLLSVYYNSLYMFQALICSSSGSTVYTAIGIFCPCYVIWLLAGLEWNMCRNAIPLQALGVPGGCGSQIPTQSAHESGKVGSPTYRTTLPLRNYST